MKIEKIALSELHTPEKNVRIHSKKQIDEFTRSINMFGQIRPIVVDEKFNILCGNGLYEALLKMGKAEADVLVVGGLTDSKKKKLMIADNKIFNLGIDDIATLNDFFTELKDDLDIPGFEEDILKSMIEDAEEVTARISDYGIIPSDEINEMRINAEKQENKTQEVAAETQAIMSDSVAPEKNAATKSTESIDVGKYIVCPHCGEKICL